MPYSFDAAHGPGVSGASAPVNNIYSGDKAIQQVASTPSPVSNQIAKNVEEIRGFDSSEFGDMIRSILGEYSSSASQSMDKYIDYLKQSSSENSMLSQQFAREQMDYQARSDALAMAWSAQEAQKNRDYQERLANSAHQREVKDLIKAGLNPILSANNGAYTGSGATGSGFSSSGAMGSVDTAGTAGIGSLTSSLMNSASNIMSSKLYTDAQKYSTDMQYAIAKMNNETSLYMNKSNIDANKAINRMNNDYSIANANIHSAATLGAAGMNASAMQYSAEQAANAAMYGYDTQAAWQFAGQENQYKINKEKNAMDKEIANINASNRLAVAQKQAEAQKELAGVTNPFAALALGITKVLQQNYSNNKNKQKGNNRPFGNSNIHWSQYGGDFGGYKFLP